MSSLRFAGAALGALACLSLTPALAAPASYQELVKAYYDDDFRAHPYSATVNGLHDYDAKLNDVSPAAHAAEIKGLKAKLAAFQAIDPAALAASERDDREMLIGQIKGELLDEERLQYWRRNPDQYVQLATGAVFALIQRDFAPLPERMRSAIAREGQIPAMLATAKHNIQEPPRAFVEVALQNIDGSIDFFKTATPAAFAGVTDPALQKQFAKVNDGAIKALTEYKAWLKAELPKAKGSFAIGSEALAEHLADFELIDVPLDTLHQLAWSHLRDDQAQFAAVAKQLDPNGTVQSALEKLQTDHPKGDGLVAEATKELAGLKQFIQDKHILTIPPEADLRVAETPEFARALVSAEFDPPGPLEQKAKEAFYYVTPPDASLTPPQVDDYLRGFDYSDFLITSAHEVWPGHYMQFLANKAHPDWSLVRRLGSVQSTTEGWAHYTEQMMTDAGLDGPTPILHLGQLEEALWRDCRMVASFELHTRNMSVADAIQLFQKECYLPEAIAKSEAYRGTSDPGYLTYTLGKLAILKLRSDYQAKQGDKFTLADFHDRFLAAGLIPIKLIRRELMGTDGPLL